jgi:uncharacterized membrane protein
MRFRGENSVLSVWGLSFSPFFILREMNESKVLKKMKPPEYQVLRCGFDRKDDHKKPTKETLNVVCVCSVVLFSFIQ